MATVLEAAGRFFSLEIPDGWTYLEESRHCEIRGLDAADLVTIVAGPPDAREGAAEEIEAAAQQHAAIQGDRILETARVRIGGKEHGTIKVLVSSPNGPSLRREFHLSFPGRGNYFIITGALQRPDGPAGPDVIDRRDATVHAIAASFALTTAEAHQRSLRWEDLRSGEHDLFVSYKRDNAEKARFIAEQLIARGFRVWLDDYQLPLRPAEDLSIALGRGARSSARAVILGSDYYFQSPFCREEAEALIDHCGAARVLHLRLKEGTASPNAPVRGLADCRSLPYGPTDADALRAIAAHFGWKLDVPDAGPPPPERFTSEVFGHVFCIDAAGWETRGPTHEREGPHFVRGSLEVTTTARWDTTDQIRARLQGDIDDRQLFDALRRTAADHPVASRVWGVHVLNHRATRVLALTTQIGVDRWQREAHVYLPHPDGKAAVDFCLTATFRGPFSELCRDAHAFDRLVRLLRWPAMRLPPGDQLLDEAVDDVDVDDYSNVEGKLRAAIADEPTNAEHWNELGLCCLHQGKIDEAEACVERAMALAPSNPKFLNSLLALTIAKARTVDRRSLLRVQLVRAESLLARVRGLAPDYPAACASEALMRAMSGSPSDVWLACLDSWVALMLARKTLQTGRPVSRRKAELMSRTKAQDCQHLVERWARLVE